MEKNALAGKSQRVILDHYLQFKKLNYNSYASFLKPAGFFLSDHAWVEIKKTNKNNTKSQSKTKTPTKQATLDK